MKKEEIIETVKSKNNKAAWFVPACLFIGMGWGFVSYNFVGGLFLGLGAGFLLFALVNLLRKND